MSEIEDLWKKIWEKRIKHQPDMMRVSFHSFISAALPKKHGRDLRVHILIISDSGSGKSAAAYLVHDMLKSLGCTATILFAFSSAGLGGSVDESGEETESYIETHDWIGIDEAEVLFIGKQYNNDVLVLLQKSADPYAVMEKKLVSGSIQIHPKASLFLASYYLDEISETLLHRGLFQRMLCFIRELSDEESQEIERAIIDKAISEPLPDVPDDPDVQEFLEKIKGMVSWYAEHQVSWSKEAKQRFLEEHSRFREERYFTVGQLEENTILKAQSTVFRRGLDIVGRLAIHYAIVDLSAQVLPEHVSKAMSLFESCFTSLIKMVLDATDNDVKSLRVAREIVHVLTEIPELSKTEFDKRLKEGIGWSHNTVTKYARIWEGKLFAVDKEGTKKPVRRAPSFNEFASNLKGKKREKDDR